MDLGNINQVVLFAVIGFHFGWLLFLSQKVDKLKLQCSTLANELSVSKQNLRSIIHSVEMATKKSDEELSSRIESSTKVIADIQLWRESLNKQIEDNRKKVSSRNPSFHVREVR